MPFLDDAEKARIEEAVREAETKTTGEFITVIAAKSSDYLYFPTLAAAGIVLLLSGLVLLLPLDPRPRIDIFYAGQVAAFIVLALAFRWPPLKMALVSRSLQEERARRHAHQQFLDLGLSSTKDRTAVLLFVSVAEHYVEIIADRGIQAHADAKVWDAIVADFTAKVRAGQVADGFIAAIDACTAVMAEHHPWHPGDVNELPNRLIEIR
jgi:putative membrane protein